MKRSAQFRQSGYKSLEGKWGISILAALIASALGSISSPSFSVNINFKFDLDSDIGSGFEQIGTIDPAVIPLFITVVSMIALFGIAVSIAMYCIGGIIGAGHAKFNLDLNDGNTPTIATLFKYFQDWKRNIHANVIVLLRVLGGLLLFIIPGIIASYNYIALPYILAEDDTLTAREAVEKSKQMMKGNRWRFFCLQFSFIGWYLLSMLTFGILGIWLNPYICATNADFYREISGTRPVVSEFDTSFFYGDSAV